MTTDFLNTDLSIKDINKMSTLALAYIGDAVYELCTRIHVLETGNLHSLDMHKASVKLVNANAQSKGAEIILPFLTEEENSYFKRGRNAKVNSVPKHSSEREYHMATGLETLFGFLYLSGNKDRVTELYNIIISDNEN